MMVLPIDEQLPAILKARGNLVLVAPPGSGKTTRVPAALASGGARVVVLEPRRLAAHRSAAFVAEQLGEPLGQRVGYEIRFERLVSAATRLRYVTEGILTRRLLSDPTLRDTDIVILDEFHERNLQTDLALAHLVHLQRTVRPELRIVVMSATMDPEPIAAYLGSGLQPRPDPQRPEPALILRAEGRSFPVAISYLDAPDNRPMPKQVVSAIHRVVRDPNTPPGDILVFLAGMADLLRTRDELAELARQKNLDVCLLHGELDGDAQRQAFARSERTKVILATNVAETSVTIDGVTCVVDSGEARLSRQRDDGYGSLAVGDISRASADQRAGRAGRTRPGVCLRLYTQHDYSTRRPFEVPELLRTDLARPALELIGLGTALDRLPWFEPPPAAAVAQAHALLRTLGALNVGDALELTPLGRRMLELPVHPRVARVALAAADAGFGQQAAAIAAALDERPLRRESRASSASDVLDVADVVQTAMHRDVQATARQFGVDPAGLRAMVRTARSINATLTHLARHDRGRAASRGSAPTNHSDSAQRETALLQAILHGYCDRVGRRRGDKGAYLLSGGGSAALSEQSAVHSEFLVAIELRQRGGQRSDLIIHSASRIDADWLLAYPQIREQDDMVWNRELKRVERRECLMYGALMVSETIHRDPNRIDPSAAAAVLAREALAAGIERFVDRDALAAWQARVAFAARHAPRDEQREPLRAPSDEEMVGIVTDACHGLFSFQDLAGANLLQRLIASYGPHAALIERLAPTHLALPGRRRAPIHYPADGQTPWVASRLQDFMGLREVPRVAGGQVALVVHLLAPNGRPVQITQDLPGFWQRHYPQVRKELMRRYPRHAWPENPDVPAEG